MSPMWFVRQLRIYDQGRDVQAVQQLLALPQTGIYDLDTATAVYGFQRMQGLPPTGDVDEDTARALGSLSNETILPDWFREPLMRPGDEGYPLEEAAVRRVQSQYGYAPTGIIDQQTALILGQIGVDRVVY